MSKQAPMNNAGSAPISASFEEKLAKDIYEEVDGYFVWDTGRGYLDTHHLRSIADELDRRNADWDKQVRAELGPSSSPPLEVDEAMATIACKAYMNFNGWKYKHNLSVPAMRAALVAVNLPPLEVQRDAERYRWLRKTRMLNDLNSPQSTNAAWEALSSPDDYALDAAIDAAMQEKTK